MARRRMLAPIEAMWDNGQDPEETLADLQRMNEGARVEEGQRMLNALNGPKRSGIQPGFARGSGSTFGMGAGLDNAVREQQQRQNQLLGSAHAIALLTGKTQVQGTNALPDTVNNLDPRRQRVGSEGADSGVYEQSMADYQEQDQQKRINMALGLAHQRRGFDVSRPAPQSIPQPELTPAPGMMGQSGGPPSGMASDDTGRRVELPPETGDEKERRRRILAWNRRQNGLVGESYGRS